MQPVVIIVEPSQEGWRLDRFLAARTPELSRSRLLALVKAGEVTIEGRTIVEGAHRVKSGQAVGLNVPPPVPAEPKGEAIALSIVFEDRHLIVLDKPAGLVVHPAAGHESGTLVNALISHCGESLSGIGGVKRPGIVHRLDKDTSGLLVVAKSDAAHAGLCDQFAAHGRDGRLQRTYLALCWGVLVRRSGVIEAALARSSSNRTKIAVVAAGGREAITHYEVVETMADREGKPAVSLLRLNLETGRTHQIRVHMAHLGHPLLGDAVYGSGFAASAGRLHPEAREALAALGRQALHAGELGFIHPVSGKALHFKSAPPPDLARLIDALRGASTAVAAKPSQKRIRR